MTDIATLLDDQHPDLAAIFERLYPELKSLAHARLAALGPGKTITPTVLVHEACMKLLKSEKLDLRGRRYFFACAGRAMRDRPTPRRSDPMVATLSAWAIAARGPLLRNCGDRPIRCWTTPRHLPNTGSETVAVDLTVVDRARTH